MAMMKRVIYENIVRLLQYNISSYRN